MHSFVRTFPQICMDKTLLIVTITQKPNSSITSMQINPYPPSYRNSTRIMTVAREVGKAPGGNLKYLKVAIDSGKHLH